MAQAAVMEVKDAKEAGMNEKEIEMGQKHGMIKKDAPAPAAPAAPAPVAAAPEAPPAIDVPAGDPPAAPATPAAAAKTEEGIIDKIKAGKEITAEEEQAQVKAFTPEQRGIYYELKKERAKKKEAANERDLLQVKVNQLEKELAALKAKPAAAGTEDEDLDKILGDEDPEAVAVKDKPLTRADLEKIEKEKEVEQAKVEQAANMLSTKIKSLNELANIKEEKWDALCDLMRGVIEDPSNLNAKKQAGMFFDSIMASKPEDPEQVIYTVKQLAKLNPKYVDVIEKGERVPGKKGEGESDSKIDKVLKHAGQRQAGTLDGGGGKIVTHENITAAEAYRLPQAEWNKLPDNVRKEILAGKRG